MAQSGLLISPYRDDSEFLSKVSEDAEVTLIRATPDKKITEVEDRLAEMPYFVFWNPDSPISTADPSKDPVFRLLLQRGHFERNWVVTEKPFNNVPQIMVSVCQHYLKRSYSPQGRAALSRYLNHFDHPLTGINRHLPHGARFEQITLKKSSHRKRAVQVFSESITEYGISPRLQSMAAEAIDELLSNAIFSAPVHPDKTRYRKFKNRKDDFTLTEREEVLFEFGMADGYLVACVTDYFGSLTPTSLMSYLAKDYETQNYQPRDAAASAGLGIYKILQSGLSLIYSSVAKERTEAVLLIPTPKNFRDFKKAFQFFSFRAD